MAGHRAGNNKGHSKGLIAPGAPPVATLEESLSRVIEGLGTEIQARTGYDRKSLHRWAASTDNPSLEHRDAPAKSIVPLTLATGRFDIVQFLCQQVGGVFVPRPSGVLATGTLLERLAAVTAEFGDLHRASSAALRDGAVTAGEAGAIDQQLTELVTAAESLSLLVRQAVMERRPLTKMGAR